VLKDNYAEKALTPLSMGIMGILTGIIAGIAAIVFRHITGFVHNLFFLGEFSICYDPNIHTEASPWGWLIIFGPVAGALLVAFLVKTWAPEAKGHGVPEVINAIYYNDGKIPIIVAFIKSIASALSIGSGGSAGSEGPVIQVGSTFGSVLGTWISMPLRQRISLIAAGAAAGLAATFNSPLGGVAFACEVMLPSVSAMSIMPVILATVTASYIGRLEFGTGPNFSVIDFSIPDLAAINPGILLCLVPLGIFIGLAAVAFVRGIYKAEDFFDALPGNYYTRHMFGMFIMGIEMYLFLRFAGHYYVQGTGYASIMDILNNLIMNPYFLILLCSGKLLATCLTLGSGASGGVFSPSLLMGAALGSAFGFAVQSLFPGLHIDPVIFALAGMAGMVGAAAGSVLTACIMIFELTRDYNAILPVILVTGIAYITRKLLCDPNIYTLKLIRRGKNVPEGLEAGFSISEKASDIMNKSFYMVESSLTVDKLKKKYKKYGKPDFIIIEKDRQIIGIIEKKTLKFLKKHDERKIGDLPLEDFIFADKNTSYQKMLRIMDTRNVRIAVICSDSKALSPAEGIITADEITVLNEKLSGKLA